MATQLASVLAFVDGPEGAIALLTNRVAQFGQSGKSWERFIDDITTLKILKAMVSIVLAYSLLALAQFLTNWFSERVPRRFRLLIKQSVPFWKAFILLLIATYLVNLFFDLSEGRFLALTGTLAVALGFAFKDYVSSIIAGVVALFETPYRVGDRIKICNHYGEVVGYGLRGIRLRTPDDSVVTIPHSVTWTEPVVNANSGQLEAQVVTDFFFDPDTPIEQVMQVLYQAAYSSKYTQLQLPIQVVLEEERWLTHFRLKCYPMDARDEFAYKTDLIRRSRQALTDYGIQLAPAHLDVRDRSPTENSTQTVPV